MTQESRPWADHPFKLIPTPTETEAISKQVHSIATEMALAHNMMVRNLNAIYHQCLGVSLPADVQDFILFCQFTLEEIHTHHALEEKYLFPQIAEYTGEKGIMETNIAQHHDFEVGMKAFHDYVYSATFESYDGMEVRRMVLEFGAVLAVHLADEIPTLLGLEKYGGEKLAKAWKVLDAQILASIEDKHRVLPCGLGANDVTFEGGKNKNWPPLPWFIPYLTKYYFARKYKGCWRFSPCTIYGVPKELEFATPVE